MGLTFHFARQSPAPIDPDKQVVAVLGVKGRTPSTDAAPCWRAGVRCLGTLLTCCSPRFPGLEQCLLDRVRDHADQCHTGEGESTSAVRSQQSKDLGLLDGLEPVIIWATSRPRPPSLRGQADEASDAWAWDTVVGTGEGLGLRGCLRLRGGHGSGKGRLWDWIPRGPTGGALLC